MPAAMRQQIDAPAAARGALVPARWVWMLPSHLALAASQRAAHCPPVLASPANCRREVRGFRAPYYVTNGALGSALQDLGFM